MIREILQDAESRMKGAVHALEGDLQAFRTGRASPHLLDRIMVEMYGVEVPLIQIATVAVLEAQQLGIRAYDANSIAPIEKAIRMSDLGLNPANDGKIIRLNIPRLTEERRIDLKRIVGKRTEEGRVAVRNVRRDALNDLREMKEESMISEDEMYGSLDELQKLTDGYIEQIDELGDRKEEEIMEV